MKIKDLFMLSEVEVPKSDRPREKLEKYGPERLSDSELLAIPGGTNMPSGWRVYATDRLVYKFDKM